MIKSAAYMADSVQEIINHTYGARVHKDACFDPILEKVEDELPKVFPADKLVRKEVSWIRKGHKGLAEGIFARYGSGEDAQWVVFMVLKGGKAGWARAVRPFTSDTANMPWLEEYIRKNLSH